MKRSYLCTRSAQGHIVDSMRLFVTTFVGVVFGGLLGISFSSISFTKMSVPSNALSPVDVTCIEHNINSDSSSRSLLDARFSYQPNVSMIWDSSNPRGAERLPAGIVASQSDLYPHTFCDLPCHKDPNSKPKYLVTFTVGVNQKSNIDAAVKKFSDNFTIMLFHYDGRTSEWDEFEWSKRAIHVSVPKQTKWWYAKRFLHPDIVASFEYIFIWDEDLGLEHFDGNKYIEVIKKHKLEISQPGIDPSSGYTWLMTKKQKSGEFHKVVKERAGSCKDPHSPPCAAFVEIMAPVFSRDAWRCVWHMIQNDLVHGWGLDFAFEKCVEEPAHEKIGVVDSEWIVHQRLPSLGNQGKAEKGKEAWKGVRDRCLKEWKMFQKRVTEAEATYNNSIH